MDEQKERGKKRKKEKRIKSPPRSMSPSQCRDYCHQASLPYYFGLICSLCSPWDVTFLSENRVACLLPLSPSLISPCFPPLFSPGHYCAPQADRELLRLSDAPVSVSWTGGTAERQLGPLHCKNVINKPSMTCARGKVSILLLCQSIFRQATIFKLMLVLFLNYGLETTMLLILEWRNW